MMIVASKRIVKEVDGGTVEDVKELLEEGYRIDAVDERNCIGVCEGCSVPICIGDVYGITLDEAKLCENCMPKPGEVEGEPVIGPVFEGEDTTDKDESPMEDMVDLCTTCVRLGAMCAIDLPRPIKRCDVYKPAQKEIKEKT